MAERPLLTLAICCYKFERFIDEALDGAFAQTYRPLEIVVSDDCSPDGSWQRILDKVASRFPDAPLDRNANFQTFKLSNSLALVLNRNPANVGLARHENRLFELSHGEWIAFQSGDDVSGPERLDVVAKVVGENPNIKCFHCRTHVIDAEGKEMSVPVEFLKEQVKSDGKKCLPSILGAGAVYHRDVYRVFGPLGPHVGNEDHVLPFRAKLLGDIYFTERQLVRYRKHGENASGTYTRDKQEIARYRLRMMNAYYQELVDLHHAEMIGSVDFVAANAYRRLIDHELYIMWFLGNWFLHSERRMTLFLDLLSSPARIILFASRLMKRFIG